MGETEEALLPGKMALDGIPDGKEARAAKWSRDIYGHVRQPEHKGADGTGRLPNANFRQPSHPLANSIDLLESEAART